MTGEAKKRSPVAFLSYAHFDFEHNEPRLRRDMEFLRGEVRQQTGEEFLIFIDREDILWGQEWQARIDNALKETTILIPLITPSFFKSPYCRDELSTFLELEAKVKRGALIFPIYYVDMGLTDESEQKRDKLVRYVASRQYVDWQDIRLDAPSSPKVLKLLSAHARQLAKALKDATPETKKLAKRPATKRPDRHAASQSTGRSRTSSRPVILPSGKRKPLENHVFINCPLDEQYRPLFEALVFAIHDMGFVARHALEITNPSRSRLEYMLTIISECKYAVHDISRTELDPVHRVPRFNVPLELGLYLGSKVFGDGTQRSKNLLIMDKEPFRYQRFISDLAGQDVLAHHNKPQEIIKNIRNWLRVVAGREVIPGGQILWNRYLRFKKELPLICRQLNTSVRDLTYLDLMFVISEWQKSTSL